MRLYRLVLADLKCQYRYGFFGIYVVLCAIYFIVLNLVPESQLTIVRNIIIMIDPMTLGLFLMGAWILLEKSQKTITYIGITPITYQQYIISKCISMSFLGILVTSLIISFFKADNFILSILAVFLGSIIMTLIGIVVGARSKNINIYVMLSIPFEIWAYGPVLLSLLGFENWYLSLSPGYIIWQILNSNTKDIAVKILCLIIWTVILFFFAYHETKRIFISEEG